MYQSPFRIIDVNALPQEPEALRRALRLEKKKLLAEFELAGSAAITIHGRELHRHEVISLFDESGNESRLHYHRAIWQDRALLQFLEEGRMAAEGQWAPEPIYEDAGFVHFVSPYFAAACDAFMQRTLSEGASAGELHALHQNKALLLPADTEAAYRYVTRFFTEKKNELLSIRYRIDNGEAVSVGEISKWCTDDQIHLLNRLPDTFTALRYTLANSLNNLCVAYDRKKDNRHALAAIERAATIRIEDQELEQLIPSNLRIIRSKQSRTWYNTDPNTGKKTPKIGFVIVLIVIIIRIATASDGCNRSATSDFRDFPSISYKETPAHELSFRSLLKTLAKPCPVTPADTFSDNHQYMLVRPTAAGDNPFRNLFTDSSDGKLMAGLAAGDTNKVLVNNESDWEAIIIYQLGNLVYGSMYVPPHMLRVFCYRTPGIAIQVYAGRSWSGSVMHVYEHYVTPVLSIRRLFWGGYSIQAATPFEDTTGEPMFRHQSDTGHTIADTLTLSNATGNAVDIAYNPGGGD